MGSRYKIDVDKRESALSGAISLEPKPSRLSSTQQKSALTTNEGTALLCVCFSIHRCGFKTYSRLSISGRDTLIRDLLDHLFMEKSISGRKLEYSWLLEGTAAQSHSHQSALESLNLTSRAKRVWFACELKCNCLAAVLRTAQAY